MDNELLTNRIRERLEDLSNLKELRMMGGLAFMYNDKILVGVYKDAMMVRIDPAMQDEVLERNGCRQMDFNRPMKGYVLVDETGMRTKADFDYWINLALAYNPMAKSSKKKK
ncbi:TfoX/Sxy family protein [Chitinophaga sancti]|uniref:TfoX N-terminal domain-containing protein n=1 Tax=Chitinophaga sancti TaxID=1004 RepID=A0A1K1SNS4_9BACT|nr:TfoX/Sxy family protein [Chitinophaga sancti]WQD64381.1 TfoX/Sxy family protein [Chitinophaga sancti]WQG89995.1 TfoX/Sxy family protein [Chitinophaga sancti]SFW86064.1 TfoX N-terminal domain-containing protein [Chitinophaga sancti]